MRIHELDGSRDTPRAGPYNGHMTHRDELRGPSFYPANLFAALLFSIALCATAWRFSNPNGPSDWQGYQNIFYGDGAYLARAGVDPIFVWVVRMSHRVFGGNGYEDFRRALFLLFLTVGAWLTYKLPTRTVSPFTTAAIVFSAFLLKSTVQIREGLALILVLLSLATVFSGRRRGALATGVGAGAAALTHIGTSFFAVTWLVSSVQGVLPNRFLSSRALPISLLLLGTVTGIGVGLGVLSNSTTVEFALRDMTTDISAAAVGGFWKSVYSVARGVAVLIIASQLRRAAAASLKFGYLYAMTLGWLIIPAVYAFTAVLVFSQFYLPAVTTFGSRILFTLMSVALVIIALRAKANAWTLLVALVGIADQYRLLMLPGGGAT